MTNYSSVQKEVLLLKVLQAIAVSIEEGMYLPCGSDWKVTAF